MGSSRAIFSKTQLKDIIGILCKEAISDAGYAVPQSLNICKTLQTLLEWKETLKTYKLDFPLECCTKENFFTINHLLFADGVTHGKLVAFICGCVHMSLLAASISTSRVDELMQWIDEFIENHLYSTQWRWNMFAIAIFAACIGAYLTSL